MPRRSPVDVYERPGRPGWWGSVTTSDGSYRTQMVLGRTKTEALKRAREARVLRDRGALTREVIDAFRVSRRFVEPSPAERTLADAWADWSAAKSAKRSFEYDQLRWGILTGYLAPATSLATLSPRLVDDALAALKKARSLSTTSINRYRALLRSMLRLQMERGFGVGLDPAKLRNTPEKSRDRVLETSEVAVLLQHIDDELDRPALSPRRRESLEELRFAIRLALFTAAREGELASLSWADVDLRNGRAFFRETKNGSPRTVPLAKPALELLKAWRQRSESTPAKPDPVFRSSGKAIGRRFSRIAGEAGISDAVFHDLRRTAASRMLEAGMDARVVQSITGHKNLPTLLRVYHRASDDRRRAAVDALAQAVG